MNSVRLDGKLSGLCPLRYSPAGIPIMEFRLTHASIQKEGATERKVEFDMEGMAVSDMAIGLSNLQEGRLVRLEGFLNRKSHRNKAIVLHVNHFELIG